MAYTKLLISDWPKNRMCIKVFSKSLTIKQSRPIRSSYLYVTTNPFKKLLYIQMWCLVNGNHCILNVVWAFTLESSRYRNPFLSNHESPKAICLKKRTSQLYLWSHFRKDFILSLKRKSIMVRASWDQKQRRNQ